MKFVIKVMHNLHKWSKITKGKLRFWFLDKFGERTIERSTPDNGNWEEICGWDFNGKFYPINKGEK